MLPVLFGHQHVRVPPERFPVASGPVAAGLARLWGIRLAPGEVLVGDGVLDVRGAARWTLTHRTCGRRTVTALSNVAAVSVTDIDRSRHRTLGQPAVTGRPAPVAVHFRRPVRTLGRGIRRHRSSVTVVVDAPDELTYALQHSCALLVQPVELFDTSRR